MRLKDPTLSGTCLTFGMEEDHTAQTCGRLFGFSAEHNLNKGEFNVLTTDSQRGEEEGSRASTQT